MGLRDLEEIYREIKHSGYGIVANFQEDTLYYKTSTVEVEDLKNTKRIDVRIMEEKPRGRELRK